MLILLLLLVLLSVIFKSKKIIYLLVLAVLAFGLIVYFSPSNTGYSLDRLTIDLGADQGRYKYAQHAYNFFSEKPFLGYGLGSFGSAAANYFNSDLNKIVEIGSGSGPSTADSNALSMLVEIGLLGTVAHLIMPIYLFSVAWHKFRESKYRIGIFLSVALIAITFILEGFFAPAWENNRITFYFWLFSALIFYNNIKNNKKRL
jgi:O-antigen ligase